MVIVISQLCTLVSERSEIGIRLPHTSRSYFNVQSGGVYSIFDTVGRHDIEKIGWDIQRIAPLQIGRFDSSIMKISPSYSI